MTDYVEKNSYRNSFNYAYRWNRIFYVSDSVKLYRHTDFKIRD